MGIWSRTKKIEILFINGEPKRDIILKDHVEDSMIGKLKDRTLQCLQNI